MEIRIGSKGKTIIERFFTDTLFAEARIIEDSRVDMRYLVTRREKAFLRKAENIELMVLVSLNSNEINLVELVTKLFKDFQLTDGEGKKFMQKKAFRVGWIMCSDSGGIYLWEALETPEHRRLQGAAHAFSIVNSVTGAVCFSPGAVENRRVGELLISLSEELKGSFAGQNMQDSRAKRKIESTISIFFIMLNARLSRMRARVK